MRVLTRRRMGAVLLGLSALLALAVALGLAVGPSALSAAEVWNALTGEADAASADIVLRVRLPRVVLSLRGGDLEIEWAGPDAPVMMTGPAEHVFDGQIQP